VESGFKESELIIGFKLWVRKSKEMLRKPGATFVAAKSEHIDQI